MTGNPFEPPPQPGGWGPPPQPGGWGAPPPGPPGPPGPPQSPWSWGGGYPLAPPLPPRPQVYLTRDAVTGTRRWTVALRLFLLVPHVVLLTLLSFAATAVVVVAWFAALFTGRVPVGAYTFLADTVAYGTRVSAYALLLTDRWPTVHRQDPYPVSIWLPGPDRLNRAAVAFRIVLAYPVNVMVGFLQLGLTPVLPLLWLTVLVRGRVPRTMFDAAAAILRFLTRYYAYVLLLTAAWPQGLFGDPVDRREHDPLPLPPGWAPAPPGAAVPPILRSSARTLVGVLLGIGAAAQVGGFVASAALDSAGFAAENARDDLASAYDDDTYRPHLVHCRTDPDRFACETGELSGAADSYEQYAADVDAIDFPDSVAPYVISLRRTIDAYVATLITASRQADLDGLDHYLATHDVVAQERQVERAAHALEHALDRLAGD